MFKVSDLSILEKKVLKETLPYIVMLAIFVK